MAKKSKKIINDDMGYWNPKNHGKNVRINSNLITMKGVNQPLLGISDENDVQMMYPNNDYLFNGNSVVEYPIGKSGIHIKPENRGKFNATKKKTGKTTEQLTHSKNPVTKKRAIFAQNAAKWSHQEGGIIPMVDTTSVNKRKYIDEELQKNYPNIPLELLDRMNKPVTPGVEDTPAVSALRRGYSPLTGEPISFKETAYIAGTHKKRSLPKNKTIIDQSIATNYQYGGDILNPGAAQIKLDAIQPDIFTQQNNVPTFFQDNTFSNPGSGKWGVRDFIGNNGPIAGGLQKADKALGKVGGIGGALSTGMDLAQGFSMLKEEKNQKKQAEQSAALSDLTLQAASLTPDKPKRKYVRPEDQIIDPNTVSNSYGVGSNFLKKGGKVNKKAQFGAQAGTFGSAIGSKIFGGTGEQSGAGQIGSTIGKTAGSLLGPVGGLVGGFLGGAIGGAIGSGNQKDIREYEDRTNSNLQNAAFQQGAQSIHNQYTGFMQHGGNTNMNGDLQPLWGGNAEHVSTNPYLPDGGESVLFRGQSHDNGGIGVKFGGNKVEVEGGEPAQKLNNGGNTNSLTVFGDMKIPAYGASEIGDDKAKGRKFKSYINDLNKVENKQNKVIDGAMTLIDKANPNDVYDKLKISSGEAMLIGGDMKLKDVAKKKQMASIVQNAILETAEEHGLKSDALADGKIRKAKKGTIIPYAQGGAELDPIDPNARYVTEDQIADLEKQNYYKNLKKDPTGKTWTLDPIEGKTIPGKQALENSNLYLGSAQFQKEFAAARKKGLSNFIFSGDGKLKTTELAQNKNDYKKSPDQIIPGKPGDEVYLRDYKPSPQEEQDTEPIDNPSPNVQGVGLGSFLGAYMPFLRPTNKLKLDPGQLAGEMYSLATNQLDPVQAQLYNPLLENVSDISYQDQLNANQADFNAISRQLQNNPSAQASLAAQKYAANSSVLGEEFRQNQNQRMGTYNRNRATLNDATLKNLQILDQQYVRQSTAKSNTKAIGQAALSSIADKIGQNKLENRLLAIDQQRYNYRFGPNGMAWNWNGPAQFNTQGLNLPTLDSNGREITTETTRKTDAEGNPSGTSVKQRIKEQFKKDNPKSKNGSLVKAYHS